MSKSQPEQNKWCQNIEEEKTWVFEEEKICFVDAAWHLGVPAEEEPVFWIVEESVSIRSLLDPLPRDNV